MGRGPVIERQKQLNAAARGKSFSLHAKLVVIAAAKGADPTDNPSLAEAIYKAKKDNVTNDVIDRAIARGAGLGAWENTIESVVFEGYAAGGVAIVVTALTDNRNRTVSSIRHAFSKCGATLGESGSVANFAFRFVGQIVIDSELTDKLEEDIIESGALDYGPLVDKCVIECAWIDFAAIKKLFIQKGYTLLASGGEYIPTSRIEVTEFDKALKLHTLVMTLDEDEDVESVWYNATIAPDIHAQIAAHIESNRFRT